MSIRRHKDVIAEAIAGASDEAQPEPNTTAAPRRFSQNRMSGLTEAARMVKKPTLRLKPSECTIWPGNARDYAALNEHRLQSLIASIKDGGENQVPATVRRTQDAEKPYEVIVGTRRHWAVSHLNAAGYTNVDFIAYVEDISDEAAFRLADLENREREDISDLERGANYKMAVDAYYEGIQSRMAERLSMTTSTLSRYIRLTELPASVIAAFSSPADIQVRHAEKLSPLLKDVQCRGRLEAAANEISMAQSLRQSEGQDPLPASEVLSQLIARSVERRGRPTSKPEIAHKGISLGQVLKDTKKGLTLNILPTASQSVDEILEGLRPVIEAARFHSKR